MTDLWVLPAGWQWATMGEVAKVVGGSTPKTGEPSYWGGDIPWITPDDLSGFSDKHIERGRRSITQAGYDSCSTQMVPARTVLYTSRAPIGYVAIAANPVCTNQGFKSFICGSALEPEYAYWYLRGAGRIVGSLASGTTFLEISAKAAARIPVPLAPRTAQAGIVRELEAQYSRFTAGSGALTRAMRQLTQLRGRTYETAVNKREGNTWSMHRLRDLATSTDQAVLTGPFGTALGRRDFASAGIPVLTVGSLKRDGIEPDEGSYVEAVKADQLGRYRVRTGDILFSRMATVGRAAVVPDELDGALINYHLMRLRLDSERLDPHFLVAFIRGSMEVREYLRNVNHGATRPGINTKELLELPIVAPAVDDQRRIMAAVEARVSSINHLEQDIRGAQARAQQLSASLWAAAFSGGLALS